MGETVGEQQIATDSKKENWERVRRGEYAREETE
jgi:hypothetical protein